MREKQATLKERVLAILNAFEQQEIGNRLSQFSMATLKSLIIKEIEQEEENKDGNTATTE